VGLFYKVFGVILLFLLKGDKKFITSVYNYVNMSGNNGLEGLCRSVEGRFNHNFDILNDIIVVDQTQRDFPDAYLSQIQTDFPHAYVILKAVDFEGRWNFTSNALEGLFNDSEMQRYSTLKDLFVVRNFFNGEVGKEFISRVKDDFFEKFADSLTGQVMQYLSQVNDGSVELQDNPVVLGDKYLVTRNYENGLNVYDLEKDLVPLRLCLAKDNGLKLTRTLRDREVIQMVERSDNLYYAKFGTNFSHETDNQSDIYYG